MRDNVLTFTQGKTTIHITEGDDVKLIADTNTVLVGTVEGLTSTCLYLSTTKGFQYIDKWHISRILEYNRLKIS